MWLVWSVILLVAAVLTLVDGSEAVAIYGPLFLLVFFGPLLWIYLKYAAEERERQERAEKVERGAAEFRAREKKRGEKREREERAVAEKYRTMAREWERRWGTLTTGLSEEEVQKLHKEFLTDNPGRFWLDQVVAGG